MDMCVKLPFTKEEMLNVSGVGENKYEKYGARFQQAIQDFTGGNREKLFYEELQDMKDTSGADMKERNDTDRKEKSGRKKSRKEPFLLT